MSLSYAQTWALTFNCFLCYGLVWIVLRGGEILEGGGEMEKYLRSFRRIEKTLVGTKRNLTFNSEVDFY